MAIHIDINFFQDEDKRSGSHGPTQKHSAFHQSPRKQNTHSALAYCAIAGGNYECTIAQEKETRIDILSAPYQIRVALLYRLLASLYKYSNQCLH